MSFVGPILEKWLLEGKATYKSMSIGYAGLCTIPVPAGKTYIITKIDVLPFQNIITNDEIFADALTFSDVKTQNLRDILSRSEFQLLFWNQTINNSWNFRNRISINTYEGNGSVTHTAPSLTAEQISIETFMLVESDSWLFLKYPNILGDIAPQLSQSQLNQTGVFNGSQNWPPSPYLGYSDQWDIFNVDQFASDPSFFYDPQGFNSYTSNPDTTNNVYLKPAIDLGTDPNAVSTFIPPYVRTSGETGGPLTPNAMFSLPLYNVHYIEVNRRLSTQGLL
jgi:hypothetical protein